MKIIKLEIMGSFLSGRSLAKDLISKEFNLDYNKFNENVSLDFNGVENVSQSFLSELLFGLKEKNINLYDLEYLNLSSESIRVRIAQEIERINNICSKSASI